MSRGTITFRAPQNGDYVKVTAEEVFEVTAYLSPNDGCGVIEIDTQDDTGEIRVYVNDGPIYAGDPEGPENNGLHLFRELFKAVAACEAPAGTQVDEVLSQYQSAYDRVKENR